MGGISKVCFVFFPLAVALACAAHASVMGSTNYTMEADVFAGGTASSATGYDLNAFSVGELVAGNASSGRYFAYVGFLATGAEKCNGWDDDQDGSIDEGPWPAETCGNGVDDDCDGSIDEGACGTVAIGGTDGTAVRPASGCTYSCAGQEVCPGTVYATSAGEVCCSRLCIPARDLNYADVAITSMGLSKHNASSGDLVEFTIKIRNRGSAASGKFEIAFYILREPTQGTAAFSPAAGKQAYALFADESELATWSEFARFEVNSLAPGAETTISASFDTTGYSGVLDLGVMLDSENSIREIDEVNNWADASLAISGGITHPEICGNNIDDDQDGMVDEDCTEICGNLIDDDLDGRVDEGCTIICDGNISGVPPQRELECAAGGEKRALFSDKYVNGFCLGGCEKTLTIYADGSVGYIENMYGNVKEMHATLTSQELQRFKNTVENSGFLALDKDYYTCRGAPTDAGSHTYEYTSGGTIKKAGFYSACTSEIDLSFPRAFGIIGAELGTISGMLEGGAAPSGTSLADIYACTADADCTNIQDGCCDCNYGGRNTSINRRYVQCWLEHLEQEFTCSEAFCITMPSLDPSCFALPKCVNGLCTNASGDACSRITPETCGNNIDDDLDGMVDEDCTEVCTDGIDNDLDGRIDEGCGEICDDHIDNDLDGLTDEDCYTMPEICGDGIDNDFDGRIDEGCGEICGNNIDDDLDGLIDEECYELQEICGNNLDDDHDGLVDEPPCTDGVPDSDDDGLTDEVERGIGSDPYNPDTDSDSLRDGKEINETDTSPILFDTDEDNVGDGQEFLYDITDPVDPMSNLLELVMKPDVPVGGQQEVGVKHPALGLIQGISAQVISPSGAKQGFTAADSKITFTVKEEGVYTVLVSKKAYSASGTFNGVGTGLAIGGYAGDLASLIFGSSLFENPLLVLLLCVLSIAACILAYRNSAVLFRGRGMPLAETAERREKLKRAGVAVLFFIVPLLINRFLDTGLAILFAVLEIAVIYAATYMLRAKTRAMEEKPIRV
ncbi:MAG: CARDB domain-containing protein [Candidatus Diapherotrites archaeon]